MIDKHVLEAAKMAEFLWSPSSASAEGFTEHLAEITIEFEQATGIRQRKRKEVDLKSFKRGVAAFGADLLHHYSNSESEGFMYRPANRVQLSHTLVSTDNFDQLIKLWAAIGLIVTTGSFEKKIDFEGASLTDYSRARRLRATPALTEKASGFGITPENVGEFFTKRVDLVSTVIVKSEERGSNGRKLPSKLVRKNPAKLKVLTSEIAELNDFLANKVFNLSESPRIVRIFNRGNSPSFNYNMGGRLYCASEDSWIDINSEKRRLITIDGMPTVEIDVQASHLAILYGVCGKTLKRQEDPYRVPNVEREVVKKIISATLGKGTFPTRWPKGFKSEYLEEHGRELNSVYKLKDVVSAVNAAHPILNRIKPYVLDWARLQFEESEIFVGAMLELARNYEVPSLPVHDSLIIKAKDEELAVDILKSSYQRRLNVTPNIRAK